VNLISLSLAGLRGNGLTHALNGLLLGLGLGTITLLLLVSGAAGDRIVRDAGGIDLVVGAKGSPLQLVLSTVFQADVPTGNIPLAEAETLLRNPMIDRGAPVALGDAVKGFRIVGTTPDYLDFYGAKLAQGQIWQEPMDAVLGADVARRLALHPGDSFVGAHGVAGNGGMHDASPYHVTGILAPTGSVIDRLVVTPVESVWQVHERHHHLEAAPETAPTREVTAVLLHARTPLAIVTLPFQINSQTNYQAAAPSIETARLFSTLGFGLDTVRAFAGILIVSAGLGILIALTTRLRERRRELATLRLLGATPRQLFAMVIIEAMLLAILGAALGLALGHAAAWAMESFLPAGNAMAAMDFRARASEWLVPALALGVGVVAAIIPAIGAYRTDVASALAGNHD
jgi:putative ABC transport system permease protein